MECNEISMCMDVKLDIYNKRPDSLKFKTWTRCQVKIEAIKCLPCFLRITIQSQEHSQTEQQDEPSQLCVSINVPGVTISLATSRTKQYSYGLFWAHNRRDCFIYFASDTDVSCRKHMKWIKKSVKNLEVYRQVFLEQRRNSRGPTAIALGGRGDLMDDKQKQLRAVKDALSILGPLPQIPVTNSSLNWSRRVSRASDIYEEIFEGNIPPRLSRRLSRASIASGIYEEMRPCSQSVINAILEERLDCPPAPPPLPPHRKRVNTYEGDSSNNLLSEIPRSNTNPESESIKKKKYKNVLDNIFGTVRSKRSESVSESQTCTMEDIISGGESKSRIEDYPDYANDILRRPDPVDVRCNKRNSFSSPDLSKINFLDTFDEEKIAALLMMHNSNDDLVDHDDDLGEMALVDREEHNFSSISLDNSTMGASASICALKCVRDMKVKAGSMESLNMSEKLSQNFNFSACNTSSINLVGSSGAVPTIRKIKCNKIVIEDDLTGYCIMAPIVDKKTDSRETATTTTSSTTSSTSSGYSTGSYCSTTSTSSSNTNSSELNKELSQDIQKPKALKSLSVESDYDLVPLRKKPIPIKELNDSNIYENMQSAGSPINVSVNLRHDNTPPLNKDFSGNLYENLLTIKAAQELEQSLPANLCTSTPTDSIGENDSAANLSPEEQENYYQTPRKSIISVDDKVPSYYPNSCDTIKAKRGSISPSKQITPKITNKGCGEKEKSSNILGLKHLVNIKMKRERKENLYISSPQKILEQRKKSMAMTTGDTIPADSSKSRKSQNALKIAENVYTVNLSNKKSSSLLLNNNYNNTEKSSYKDTTDSAHVKEKLHTELLQLALLQNIDFKFDDATDLPSQTNSLATNEKESPLPKATTEAPRESGIRRLEEAELEYENCYRATKDATRLLHKYATLAPIQSMRIKQQLQHHLQINQMSNMKDLMTQSTKLESPVSSSGNDLMTTSSTAAVGSKKFASLPRFKKIDFSPLKLKINNVLQRNQQPDC